MRGAYFPKRWAVGLAIAASLILAITAIWMTSMREGSRTPGGTLIAANTDIQLVDLDTADVAVLDRHAAMRRVGGAQARSIELVSGRARFSIGGARPDFTVAASNLRITAHNAVFDIDSRDGSVTVTILGGRVSIERHGHARLTLAAFERFDADASGERTTAIAHDEAGWTVALLPLDGRTLGEVAAITQRADGPRILLADPALAGLKLQGQLRVGDIGKLARQLAAALELEVEHRGDDFVLRRRE